MVLDSKPWLIHLPDLVGHGCLFFYMTWKSLPFPCSSVTFKNSTWSVAWLAFYLLALSLSGRTMYIITRVSSKTFTFTFMPSLHNGSRGVSANLYLACTKIDVLGIHIHIFFWGKHTYLNARHLQISLMRNIWQRILQNQGLYIHKESIRTP